MTSVTENVQQEVFDIIKKKNRAFIVFALCFVQAGRARQLGATVYCVGVKDFNETQVSSLNFAKDNQSSH